ncbi:MAG: potassium transporter Kup [Lysobacterales bacterium]|nr:MAG: potassium transporter Kup [Xanthomonadales bacterium]
MPNDAALAVADAPHTPKKNLTTLTLAALGVVYGDIGTSPLYALRECFSGPHGIIATEANVLGVISLIIWSLLLLVSVKYVAFVLRADFRGEGGILALMALACSRRFATRRRHWSVLILGVFGATLFYGDAMITPAISVLSAIEGLNVATAVFEPWVVPLTLLVLIGLFLVQSHGTDRVGKFFGPVMLVWFGALAVFGVAEMLKRPDILAAVHPRHAYFFFRDNQWHAFVTLGAVFLVMTGGEALYADMGHFGRRPIRRAWFALVLPAILLNYFGQGALLLANPAAAENPFYLLVPAPLLYPMVGLATAATVIASQAVISGVFSLTRQAMQLGYAPRMSIEHTSAAEIGQIYIPAVNWTLLVAVLLLVLGFESSSRLAAAYGIAVTLTMVITTLLLAVVTRRVWGWHPALVAVCILPFLAADLAFLGANALKIPQGGWFPLVVSALLFTFMTTWKRGRKLLARRLREEAIPIKLFVDDAADGMIQRVSGTAIFLTSNPDGVPHTLLHNLKHNKVMHERVVLLTVRTEEVPFVREDKRVEVETIGSGFYRVHMRFGFTEDPDVQAALVLCEPHGLQFELMETTFFLGRETLISTSRPGMARWRERLFIAMSRSSARAMDFFNIPINRVVELGTQIEL